LDLFQSSDRHETAFAEKWTILAPRLEALMDQMELALDK